MAYSLKALGLVILFCFAFAIDAPAQTPQCVIHVFVALADNAHQGIVPVPPKLGDGDAPATNLYWGAAFGVKSYFRRASGWQLLSASKGPKPFILERCIFRYRNEPVYLVADAYQGSHIREAVSDFLAAASGLDLQRIQIKEEWSITTLAAGGAADLVAYVGHDAFMDFQVAPVVGRRVGNPASRSSSLARVSRILGPT